MAERTSLYTDCAVTQLIDPATLTSDTNSISVDMKGYSELLLVVNVGESGDTLSGSVYIELEVEESADDSTFTDVADANLVKYVAGSNNGCFGVIDSAAKDDTPYYTAYRGTSRYVRVPINMTGTHSNGTPISVTAIRKADVMPANAVTT